MDEPRATLVPAPKQHFTREDKEQIKEKAIPADWTPAKRRQKDLEATWTKKHGKSSHGFKLSISVARKHKLIRKWVIDTASVHDSQHFDAVLDAWMPARKCMWTEAIPVRSAKNDSRPKVYGGVSKANAAGTTIAQIGA